MAFVNKNALKCYFCQLNEFKTEELFKGVLLNKKFIIANFHQKMLNTQVKTRVILVKI